MMRQLQILRLLSTQYGTPRRNSITAVSASAALLIAVAGRLLIAVTLTVGAAGAHGGGGGGGHGGGGGFHSGGHYGGGHYSGGHVGGHAGSFHSYYSGHSAGFYGMSHVHTGAYYGLGHHAVLGQAGMASVRHRHYLRFENWGTYYAWNHWNGLYGYWGSWSNPWLNAGWNWGVLGTPLYATGSGFASVNPLISSGMVVDEEGNTYPGTTYRFDQAYITDYSWDTSNRISATSDVQDETSRYRLGPDAELLKDGKVVIGVTNSAYLLVSAKATQLIDSQTGLPVVALSTDPAMLWHLSAEMKRQMLGLQSVIQLRQEAKQQMLVSQSSTAADAELTNLQATVDLLKQAQSNIGEVAPTHPTPPVVPDATELFAGTWATPDGKFVVLRRPDSSLAYTDGKDWFSDQGKTKIPGPDADSFKDIVVAYVSGLVTDAPATLEGLKQDKADAQVSIQTLKDEMDKLKASTEESANAQADEDIIAMNRDRSRLEHLNQRLDLIDKQAASITKDVDTIKVLLTNWQ